MTQRFEEPLRTMGRTSKRNAGDPVEPETIPADFKPIRVWTAGPGTAQEKLVIPGTSHGLKPRPDGSYLLDSPRKVDVARKALGGRWWPDDIPEGEESPKCDACGWTSRSFRAMYFHMNNAHGRPQTS